MSLESLIILLIAAAVVGTLAQLLSGYTRSGLLGSTLLGFIGVIIGNWGVREFGLPGVLTLQIGGTNFPIVWAILGAALFISFLGLLTRAPVFVWVRATREAGEAEEELARRAAGSN
jgi:uncharacterized membrane protein YeaQ/YmgE (transglycosylase-associated protein family)